MANVRLKFCRLLPSFKLVLKPPTDLSLAARLNEALSHLLLDRDTDVVQAATKVNSSCVFLLGQLCLSFEFLLFVLEGGVSGLFFFWLLIADGGFRYIFSVAGPS